MNSVIETNHGPALHWTVVEDKQPRLAALQIVLHQRTYVLPWSRFIYAEGTPAEIMISFATHEVLVTGYGLDHLLADIAAHLVVSLHEPNRADNFRAAKEADAKGAFSALFVRQVIEEE